MPTSEGVMSGCGNRVSDGGVAAVPLLVHPGQHRHEDIHVVDDRHRALALVEPVEGVLKDDADH